MPNLRIHVEIQKGKSGVPLRKLSKMVGDIQEFLSMLSDDISLPDGGWIGHEFGDGSLSFIAKREQEIDPQQIREFNTAFVSIVDRKPLQSIRRSTVARYAKIADPMETDEVVSFDLYEIRPAAEETLEMAGEFVPLRHVELSKVEASSIESEVQAKIRAYGSIQGRIHSLYLGADQPHFNIRELSTNALIRCSYAKDIYPEIAKALQRDEAVVHVYGTTETDLVERRLEEMKVTRIDVAEDASENDVSKLFGGIPNFTGKLTTQEFMRSIRGRIQ